MENFLREVDKNFKKFSNKYSQERNRVSKNLESSEETFKVSYRRIVSLQSWRSVLLENKISADSLGFFLEAQNDALVSHTHARVGAWRSSLKALRSCVEN